MRRERLARVGDARIADIPGDAVGFSVRFAAGVTDRMRKRSLPNCPRLFQKGELPEEMTRLGRPPSEGEGRRRHAAAAGSHGRSPVPFRGMWLEMARSLQMNNL